MAKRAILTPINLKAWCKLAKKSEIRNRMKKDSYSMAYPILVSHFSGIRRWTWDDAMVGLHIVYGWMPTIPKLQKIMLWNEVKKQNLVKILNQAKHGIVPSKQNLELLKSFCNNSIVGGSKLLHFLNPEVFPIWDSRVARAFFQKKKLDANNINKWEIYQTTLTTWVKTRVVICEVKKLRSLGGSLGDATSLRLIESVMFQKYVSKRNNPAK